METTTVSSTGISPGCRPPRRVALACVQCRNRKVKCDASMPVCKRCQADDKHCEYLKSRRGGRPRHKHSSEKSTTAGDHPPPTMSTQWDEVFAAASSNIISYDELSMEGSSQTCSISGATSSTLPFEGSNDHLLTQYYTFFHPAHPSVLPRWSLQARNSSNPSSLEPLLPVMIYIGSIFTPSVPSAPLENIALRLLDSTRARGGRPSPFFVQALELYAVAVYWNNQTERALELLHEAIRGALGLGMHRTEWAVEHGEGDPVLEECWRRTWWMIYVTDAHISGSTHTYPTKTGATQPDTRLPCEDHQYESGNIPPPLSLKTYNVREFSDSEFSSFAHLVGFTQALNRVLSTRRARDPENAKTICSNADTCMTAWCSLLPTSKRRLLKADGSVDELLFTANILMHTYLVDLHRELSSLKYSPIESVSKCSPPPPPENCHNIKEDAHTHTAKVLFAIEKLNGLLLLPTRLVTHTPFIICMVANMTIAHLSACRYVFQEPKLFLEREKIRLNMGALKMLGEYWPLGERTYRELGIIAREILSLADEDIQVPEESPLMADFLGTDFEFDCAFDLSDLFGSSVGGVSMNGTSMGGMSMGGGLSNLLMT
ncbi:hypothetical protein BCR34DRAFT_485278 [Clohesyomyces aquaticus]|uniref:Zn(2)-C6 fungal-type domain-containing protein n=1 Tax=Clohesyomyces aquaticus TaxID=1231657 RepID=A0A1Y1ZK80_9PLEO|nr:hypothetical protein BCR34DRAFT_485278 [Clohesyomyces aquaticus]